MSPGRGDIPALTPAEAGTRLSDPGGMQGRVDRDRRLCDVTSPYVLQTNRQFLREYYDRTQNTTGLTGHQEAPYGYDSVWTVALMLNDSIQRMIDEGFACAVLVSTFMLASSPNIHRFKKCFIDRHSNKPFSVWLLTTPPHLYYLVIYR